MIEHHILKAVGRPPADREDVHDDLCARLAPLDRYGLWRARASDPGLEGSSWPLKFRA